MDLEAVEKIIFQDDAILAPPRDSFQDSETPKDECINPRDLYLNFEDTPSDELIPQSTRVKPDDRKVEVPLTPPDPISTSKTVTFSEIVEEMLLDTEFSDGGEDADMDALRDDPLFHRGEAYEMLKQASEAVHNTLNNEQLQEAATTKQVKVPVLDFTAPEPPWKQLEILRGSEKLTAGQRAMVLRTKQEYPFPDRATGLKVLESRIRWTPFPADLAKVALEEEIGDDEKVENLLMMTKDSDVIDSSGMTWKAPGLRILRNDDEDEDDLEPGTFMSEQPEDMTSLLKKRKLHMTDHNSFANSSQKLTALENLVTQMSAGVEEFRKVESMMMKSTMPRRKNTPSMPGDSATARAKFQDDLQENLSLVDQNFSAENALDKFMEIRGVKKPKLMTSAHFAAPTAAQELDGPDKLDQNLHQATAQALRPFPTNFPIPHIVAPSSSTPFIISSNMMKERVLVRAFQRLFPKAELIERDFKRHNTTSWLRPGSVTRSPVASPLASEADFILSPSTGLVLTTLTKIKQKPLPGEKGESEIKERIKNVCRRYERLVVLVSEAASDETTNGLNGQDSMGLSEFIGFCNSLPASVNAHFVPGGHETLAKWLVAIMIQYGIHDFSFGGLIEDETVWELFLRRCGFNAYAAQAILSVLKAPEGVNLESPSKAGIFGITAFVEMSFEERVERFEILLGGKRVLQQVSAIIDAQWLL
jgi:predicted nuclease of predicted toxin-antitoxin system